MSAADQVVKPNDGPQSDFAKTEADIAIFGGAAGGGKTWVLAYEALRYVDIKGYAGVIFRRTYPELTGGGSVWEETQPFYILRGGVARERNLDWKFPAGSMIEFRHMQHEKDKLLHQGKQYAMIGFDELTHFSSSQFWYLVSRNRSTCGVHPYIRATCNPDSTSWVRSLIDWWIGDDGFPIRSRAGKLRWFVRDGDALVWADTRDEIEEMYPPEDDYIPLSLTFIPASLDDNPKGDPTYKAKLLALPRVEREQLLRGNWDVQPAAGLYFQRDWFEIVEQTPKLTTICRAWDRAATKPHVGNRDPDWTRGVKLARLSSGELLVLDVEGLRDGPGKVEALLQHTARRDGRECMIGIWQDKGGAGVFDADNMKRVLMGFNVKIEKTTSNKITFAGPVSSFAQPLPGALFGKIKVLKARWNDEFFAELERFPDGGHDDIVDAFSLAFMLVAASSGAYGFERVPRPSKWQGGAL